MRNILIVLMFAAVSQSKAQNINWKSLQADNKHMVYFNFGYDFGLTTQLGYGYEINTIRPVVLSVDYSFPMGESLTDDFKVKSGIQFSLYEKNHFIITGKAHVLYRRYESQFVRLATIGSEIAAIAGYYKEKWHIAGELGWDKSILTHLRHSERFKEVYSSISDGWLIPSGGNFFFGMQLGKTIGRNLNLSLRLGAVTAEQKNKKPLLPYYAQLGLNWKI